MPHGVPLDFPLVKVWKFFRFALAFLVFTTGLSLFYQSLIVSLAVALLLTYLLAPFVHWVERRISVRRTIIVLGIIVISLSTIAIIGAYFFPIVYRQILAILQLLPQAIDFLVKKIDPLKEVIVATGMIETNSLNDILAELDIVNHLSEQSTRVLEQLWLTTPTVMGGVINFMFIPILLFFILNDLPRLTHFLRELIPLDLREIATFCRRRVDQTLKSVLMGQIMVAGVLAALYMTGFSVIQLKAGLAIGAIAGICRIIPYLDVVVGATLSIVVIVTQNLGLGAIIGVGSIFLVVQVLDGMIITPKIVGEKAGLHPGVIIASIISFADWFGFLGVLIAVPSVAVVMVFLRILIPYYQASLIYQGQKTELTSEIESG